MLDLSLSIGDTLREIRELRGFQLQDVAEKTTINYTSLSRIENGKRLPSKDQISLLANFYDYNQTELLKHLISDKIIHEIQKEEIGLEAFFLAEQRIKYGRTLFDEYENIEKFELQSRRYIGNKAKLTDWIMKVIQEETTQFDTFIDVFSGTGIVAQKAMSLYKSVIVNDFLHSNNIVYHAFFDKKDWNKAKLIEIANSYNELNAHEIEENYFSQNFGGKFYEKDISKIIGYIRKDIENRRNTLNYKEYSILLASLIYTIDRLANTVGHFDAYIKKPIQKRPLNFRLIQTNDFKGVKIYQEDANKLARTLKGDIAYIDPPYNSRQYSRFYHIYENLIKWKKPELFGVALKPEPENMSKYCTVKAKDAFQKLVSDLDVKYLAVSYNNTYKSKSKSSANKIKYEELIEVLESVGETKVFEQSHKFFNTGRTDFNDHKEFLFLTKKYD